MKNIDPSLSVVASVMKEQKKIFVLEEKNFNAAIFSSIITLFFSCISLALLLVRSICDITLVCDI